MEHVINIALHYGIDVRIGIYGTMAFFDTTSELLTMSDYTGQIPSNIHKTQENFDFVTLYDEWRRGNLRLRCQSIKSSLVIHSNGDVPLCQNLDVKLGNIHEQSLDDIFNGSLACETQCRYSRQCNDCWINFHRKYDIILMRNFERLLPKWLIERFYGPYQWTNNPTITYRKLLQS
jgi:MoaA/NifB/PqqE/SkfB family radical SAM enzyme